ncbi:MAG TPA: UDP-N-acetyl-D-mannosamine dehydrogenase [Bacillota bacterium]|nr:UDP-N-acetyl-D-mannosamine dehydrogenase [Bacillota bacterium]
MKHVCVVGTGYIGLPLASLLAAAGYQVHGVDTNLKVVQQINSGEAKICEPNLASLVKEAVKSGCFTLSTTPAPADVFFISVPTPFQEGHVPDLTYVDAATRSIAPYIQADNLIVLESTVPVGTTERIGRMIAELRPDLSRTTKDSVDPEKDLLFYLAHCPERVLPGQILSELFNNDRVIGGVNPISAEYAAEMYRSFVKGQLMITNSRTAELCKLAENSFRDINIAFANELALICDRLDVNIWELIEYANHHPRVKILEPGPGVGGHCIPVDPWFIVHTVPEEARMIRTAREVNDERPRYILGQIAEKAKSFPDPAIACLGLAYKANVDDLRESPAMHITRELARMQTGRILVVEPNVDELPELLSDFKRVQLVDLATALEQANIIVLLVKHQIFVEVDRRLLQGKVVIDTKGIWR